MSGPEGSSIKWNLARVAGHRSEPDGFFAFWDNGYTPNGAHSVGLPAERASSCCIYESDGDAQALTLFCDYGIARVIDIQPGNDPAAFPNYIDVDSAARDVL